MPYRDRVDAQDTNWAHSTDAVRTPGAMPHAGTTPDMTPRARAASESAGPGEAAGAKRVDVALRVSGLFNLRHDPGNAA